ncbi:MAG: DEAD/DEAH box helicase [Prevotella sp.]|nr:DEAD/DEAH box helicase [Prevotella sp.]
MRFDELYLNDNILDALDDMRFETCTPIQEACIPEILDGRDLIGVAQTGTGKTAAYLLPILSLIEDGYYPEEAINCVIMSPTRELAQQIDQAMEGFGYYLEGISSVAVYGGNDGGRYDQETKGLQLGANVVIATPGRLISHITMQHADLSQVSFFVLDEADRMLDMGFSDDILKIASHLPKTCQTIMFSATMPQKIEQLAKTLLKDPVEVKLAVSRPADNIMQMAYVCHENQKLGIIRHLFMNNELSRVIIFAGSKQKVKEINRSLRQMHINSGEMHSDLDQSQRDEMMYRFKSGQVDVLVATDIVARGIDIDDIATVMNFDVPHDSEDYVHRIGRTARAQRDGKAITLVRGREIADFMQIEKFLGYLVEKIPLPEGLGEGPEYKPMGRGGRGGHGGSHGRRRGNASKGRGESSKGRGEHKGRGRRKDKAPQDASPKAEKQTVPPTTSETSPSPTAAATAKPQRRRRKKKKDESN